MKTKINTPLISAPAISLSSGHACSFFRLCLQNILGFLLADKDTVKRFWKFFEEL